jgi:uncharacterized protein
MLVVWDEAKALSNLKKHGVDFLEAMSVLNDPMCVVLGDQSAQEQRFLYIGHSVANRLLVVVACYRDESTVRLISARKVSTHERRIYEERV